MLATASKPMNAYDVALENFDLAANALGLDDNIRVMIKYPERILCVSVPVRMDTGKIARFEGYRVQHNTMRGPAKGGIRYHPNVTVDEVEVRRSEYSLRRRQGRRDLQPERNVDGRTRTHDPPVCHRHSAPHRPRERYPGARCLHPPTDDGVDHGYLQHEQGLPGAWRRDRQADQPRRLSGPQRSHRPRRVLYHFE